MRQPERPVAFWAVAVAVLGEGGGGVFVKVGIVGVGFGVVGASIKARAWCWGQPLAPYYLIGAARLSHAMPRGP